jgi:ABC-type sugar transport system substrate-binding protein
MKWSVSTRRWQRAGVAAGSLALVAGSLAACSSAAPSGNGAASGGGECSSIAYLINNISNPWISTMADGGEARAQELGVTIDVQNADLDTASQISQIQQAIADKVSGILIQSVEADGVVPAIQQANAAGIPVVAVNSGVGDGAEIVTYVGVDQYDYGVGLGELAIQAAPDGGKVAIIQGVVGNPVATDRTAGATETIQAAGNYEIVATVTDSWSNDENLAAVQDLLNRFPAGQLDVIVAEGPQVYVGAEYAHSIGRDDVKFVAGDFPVQVKDAIEAGTVFGTVLQDGAQQGTAGVDALCNWIEGNESAVKRPTDFVDLPLVTKENLADFSTDWNW